MDRPGIVQAPGWRHALRFWWSFSWRWPLLLALLVLPIAVFVALTKPSPQDILALARWQETGDLIAKYVSAPLAFVAQIIVLRRLLRVDYRDFSVRVVENKTEGE